MKEKTEKNVKNILIFINRGWNLLNQAILKVDGCSLWWFGLFLTAVSFLPVAILREGSVFEIHDQLDETLLTYVLNAKYLGTGTSVFPELLGGVNASGMQPSGVLFILLYKVFPVFTAFVLQAMAVFAAGYFGMYLTVRELTKSGILATVTASIFSMLPIQPVYGLSVVGVPLLLYAFLGLYQRKRLILSFVLIAFFGLTTHLVLIGYVALSFWVLAVFIMLVRKKHNGWVTGGFVLLTGIYLAVNYRLFLELIVGGGGYVSHREELVNYSSPFWDSVKGLFLESAQHAPSCHRLLLIPIGFLLVLAGIRWKHLSRQGRRYYRIAIGILVTIVLIALFYGICKSQPVTAWKNERSGFLRYFQIERYYWLYPTLWYLEAAVLLSLFWQEKIKWLAPVWKLLALIVLLWPTVQQVKLVSMPYRNINQINNGTGVTGYITWESFYSEDLMQEIEDAIGRDKETYRIAHLGISPAPALMHGFYTIDGYSNNYPLEYKHDFRKIIEGELGGNEAVRLYFDEWGSRCYLFSEQTGAYWMLEKGAGFQYQDLKLDVGQMRFLGCEYLLSGAQIENALELGLKEMGYYETQESYWGIWLYGL